MQPTVAADLARHTGRLDRTRFGLAHNQTVYVQGMFDRLAPDEIRPGVFAYGPCWALLDPGMTVEPHEHAIPEFYVFTAGEGTMRLGGREFPVKAGVAVNIPPNVTHTVNNPGSAVEPLVWVSIGLRE
jgi:mannose-6-phosphate isomerase-like protein (cupin superfamily)